MPKLKPLGLNSIRTCLKYNHELITNNSTCS